MDLTKPTELLGSYAPEVRDLLVTVIGVRHDLSAQAHALSKTRYSMGFGSQWRDLLDDVREAAAQRGFEAYKVFPAGYHLPIVNDCLVCVWRVPGTVDPVASFASSPTRKNMFAAERPRQIMMDLGLGGEPRPTLNLAELAESQVKDLVRDVGAMMPVVLVKVHSTPEHLRLIEWGIAAYDEFADTMDLTGLETIWLSEGPPAGLASEVESFDSGTPSAPAVDVWNKENNERNAG
ncbi:MAG: hypothetical protein ACRC0L_08755 [Angustibacter sp.]